MHLPGKPDLVTECMSPSFADMVAEQTKLVLPSVCRFNDSVRPPATQPHPLTTLLDLLLATARRNPLVDVTD
jgi:hypothetical protein